MTDKRRARRPAAFRAGDVKIEIEEPAFEEPLPAERRADALASGGAARAGRGLRWGSLLLAGLTGLAGLGLSLWLGTLVEDLFARQDWIGWLALALIGLVVFAAVMLVLRELWALMRLSRLGRLRQQAARAIAHDDKEAAAEVGGRLRSLYSHRPELDWGRARLAEHEADIMDAAERLTLAERELMRPLDVKARALVADTAKRVSVLTAVSPFALIDVAFVAQQNLTMLRRLAGLYGARPGTIGLMRLARMVVSHLVLTGGIAIGDDVLHQLIGHGVTAKLSARLGEGMVNGALTARIGIATIDVCRPLPFIEAERPRIRDIVAKLARG